eukprot:PITA_07078
MSFLSSPRFSILFNGSPSLPFRSSRGIRQGDPLSPFLFILMAEGLSRLIHHATSFNSIKGISLHDNSPITYQKFVDDNLLFGHPSVQEAWAFKSLLNTFSDASITTINSDKSQNFFFSTPSISQRNIARILGFSIDVLPSNYLRVPLVDLVIKHASQRALLDKLEAKLSSWMCRSLNMASRIILIKLVLQAMPLYLFSIIAAPKWVLKQIHNLQRNFLWGSSGINRKWALVKWTEVKYAPGRPQEDLIHIIMDAPDSMIWNAAKQHSAFIQAHSFWEIQSGDKVRFWEDSWQQMSKLSSLFHKPLWQSFIQNTIPNQVNQLWQPLSSHGHQLWKLALTWQED